TLVRVGIPRRRICVVPNGVPLDEAALSAPIARPVSPLRILVVGTRVPEKNHVAVFEALGALSSRDFVVDHLGRCGEHPSLDKRVADAIRAGGLTSRVHEHGRQVDVGRWYGRANLLVHPSLSEGFPNVVLEAWSWGCPVLVSDRGDLPRIVEHGVTGLVAPLGRSSGLLDALGQALDDPEALHGLAARGRAHVREHFAISAVAAKWRELFQGSPQDLPQRIRQRGSRMWQALHERLPFKEE
ncbi:MAG: glycosyltransferase family 4 protein, partial [Myxococcota bacterium]